MTAMMVEITVAIPADKVETLRRCADLLASGSPECSTIERAIDRARITGVPVLDGAAPARDS